MKTLITYPIILFTFLTFLSSNVNAADIKNISKLSTFENQTDTAKAPCREMECRLFVHVVKATQKLHLYVDGVLTDTFSVSTGKKNHDTPEINMRPNGPTFRKYSSRKYPGGDYQGLGNMPYVVFIKGGYGIHGTTPGNFLRLGHKASHGCIRLHPNNAKYFYELVQQYGLENTWVKVTEY